MSEKTGTETIQTIVTLEMHDRLVQEAANEHRPLASMIRVIILRYWEGKDSAPKTKRK